MESHLQYVLPHVPAVFALMVATLWKDVPTSTLLLFVIGSYILGIYVLFTPTEDELSKGIKLSGKASGHSNTDDYKIAVVQARSYHGKIEYKLKMQYNGVHWHCWRSYSKFLKFREQFPNNNGSHKFPGKSSVYDILSGRETTLEFIEKRRKRLDAIMRETIGEKKEFEAAVLAGKDPKTGRSPAGLFLGQPKDLDLSQANVAPPRDYLVQTGTKAMRELLAHLSKIQSDPVQEPWKLLSEAKKNNIKCYTFEDGDLLHICVRGETDSNAPDLLEFLIDAEIRGEWDELHESQTTLDEMYFDKHPEEASLLDDEGYEIVAGSVQHSTVNSPAPMIVAKRDSVTVALVAKRKSDGALLLCLTSIEDKRAPPEGANKYIRAKVLCAGTLIEPIPGRPGHCRLFTASLIDPAAYVPHSLIKMIAPTRALEIANFGKMAKDRAAKKPPRLGNLLHHKQL
uniref:START domain-containing protein n=1 Tax=Aplanochytrium stocchinoi TaxID=215587 RepID=A0A7S3PQQ2_9STRA